MHGFDEALRGEFDETIFPKVLPPTLKILVSARWQLGDSDSKGWLRRLDWLSGVKRRTVDLETLNEPAIADVLIKMGTPTDIVAADPILAKRFFGLTLGEPLLLRYYAEDLWQMGSEVAHVKRADLDSSKPGFGVYFDRWLEHQQKAWREAEEAVDEETVDLVLIILAIAYAPLEGADLCQLINRLRKDNRIFNPQRLLARMKRFVIGDGSERNGYVLSHPKIGEHLQQERFHSSSGIVQQAFADWGRSIIAAVNQDPSIEDKTPRYLVQFYRRHPEAL